MKKLTALLAVLMLVMSMVPVLAEENSASWPLPNAIASMRTSSAKSRRICRANFHTSSSLPSAVKAWNNSKTSFGKPCNNDSD